MEDFLRFLNTYELWIYGLVGGILLIYLRKFLIAWKGWRSAVFGLEKEGAQRKLSAALTVVVLLGLMVISEFIIISFVVPAYPKSLLLATPTMDLLSTPTATLNVLDSASMVLSNNGTTPEAEGVSGCIPAQIEWTFPENGSEISGAVELKGTVNIPTLGFYKFEYSALGSNNWTTIAAGNETKNDAPLGGIWNTNQLIPGDYLLRLIVTDNLNNELTPCELSVRIISEE